MNNVSLLIADQDRAADTGATFERISPLSNEVVTRAAAATIGDARAAADAAAAAFPAWSALGPGERRTRLLKAADILEARAGEFIELMQAELGATRMWAGFNAKLAASILREAAGMTTQLSGEIIP